MKRLAPMNGLVILAVLGNKITKEFTIPVTSIEECLWAADVAYCEVVTFLDEQLKVKTTCEADLKLNFTGRVNRLTG